MPSAIFHTRCLLPLTLCCLLSFCVRPTRAAQPPQQTPQPDQFALGVRETDPLTAEEQLHTFRLPPGFTIQLVAAEPQIAKPMNLAFDVRGRLWVSSSLEYPFAAPADRPGRDTIRILEDTDGDARADVVTTFADGLNIPIGLYPYRDGVICFSIPNILFLRDTDGDNRADVREVLYGPFDTSRDTHGMCNAFRRGEDGWIYACHGFNNRSEVAGRDGHKVVLHSGNTFRFRPDGSRIEHFTIGQVNPFGMAFDQWGDLFTADCHTKPVTLLLQGGNYDSFGRPHDGLGYVPNVMEHLHGSTAIAGIALGAATSFPAEFRDSSFGGNVMTSRINRNRLLHHGSSVQAVEEPDLCSTTDPWFRPVDLIPGPDGALYVADFYNRIIGHYEVDLQHPGRDRFRGRIWRISYPAQAAAPAGAAAGRIPDLTQLSLPALLDLLKTGLPAQAGLVADRIADDIGRDAVPALQAACRDADPTLRRRALRLLQRMDALDEHTLQQALTDANDAVRVHAMRTLQAVVPPDTAAASRQLSSIQQGFADPQPLVRRAAVLAAAAHPSLTTVPLLLNLFHSTPEEDVHLRHAIRMSLRDHLRQDALFQETVRSAANRDLVLLSDICLALRTDAAGEFIAEHLEALSAVQPQRLTELLQFAAQHASPASAARIAGTVQQRFSNDSALQLQLLNSMQQGFQQRGAAAPPAVTAWAEQLALQLLQMSSVSDLQALDAAPALNWNYQPHPAAPQSENPWVVSLSRRSADGLQQTPLFSSFEKGEQRTGIYRSDELSLTDRLQFYVAGHDGFPTQPAQQLNLVRLVSAESGQVLLQAGAPRNDVAQPVQWDTSPWQGQSAVVELVDGDAGTAFAWIAVGRFSDPRLNPSDAPQRYQQAAHLAGSFQLQALRPALARLALQSGLSRSLRSAMATALEQLQPDTRLAAAALVPLAAGAPAPVVEQALQAVVQRDVTAAAAALEAAAQVATSAEQLRLADKLCGDAAGAELLVRLVETGKLSARLLLLPTVQQRLTAVAAASVQERVTQLTSGLPSEDASTERRIVALRQQYQQQGGTAAAGQELFRRHCTVCHQVAGEGKKVGPNLDGLGNRGLDRVTEDLLAPNRNVDVAFRTTTVVNRQGLAISGLLRELEDRRFSLVDSQGKETLLTADDIEERLPSQLSPMPVNFADTLNEQQLRDLLAFLLSLRH